MTSTAEVIVKLLAPTLHPEGGYYHETWRVEVATGERAACSAMNFCSAPARAPIGTASKRKRSNAIMRATF